MRQVAGRPTLVDTSVGPAGVTRSPGTRGSIVLGHGAGGLRWTADLLAVREAAAAAGWASVLVDQPWRIAGRRVAAPARTLDLAWLEVLATLGELPRPLIVAGRSAGARVACRTAQEVNADGVLCVAFPLHPPGKPGTSRADELISPAAHGIPVQVIQGSTDPFGSPAEVRAAAQGVDIAVTEVTGPHSLERVAADVAAASAAWWASIRPR